MSQHADEGGIRPEAQPTPDRSAPLRIFLAGATGVIGIRLLPLLLAAGHTVAAMTRSEGKRDRLASMGAQPVVCDVFDADALRDAVVAFRPDAVLHQLTDLPDTADRIPEFAARNARYRFRNASIRASDEAIDRCGWSSSIRSTFHTFVSASRQS